MPCARRTLVRRRWWRCIRLRLAVPASSTCISIRAPCRRLLALALAHRGWTGSCNDRHNQDRRGGNMRPTIALVVALAFGASPAMAGTAVQIAGGNSSLQFDFLYSNYSPERSVVEREVRVVGEPDVLVGLHLCSVTGKDLEVVLDWRRSGMSWYDITRRCGRDASIYYIDVPTECSGPPYGRAHGYWKKHPRGDLHLDDGEIREFVLVRSLAKHCGMPTADVVRLRARGESPRGIADRRSGRHEDAAPKPAANKHPGKGRGKSGK